jgi:hypothetical protein
LHFAQSGVSAGKNHNQPENDSISQLIHETLHGFKQLQNEDIA